MFSKLLKHEWKANLRLLTILSCCALGAGVLGAGVLRGAIYLGQQLKDDDPAAVLGVTGLYSILSFVAIGLVAYLFAVQFINLFRFYKNKFTDEGYLTFTLPVSTHQIFWASFLHILAWFLLSLLVVAVSVALILIVGGGQELQELLKELSQWTGPVFGELEDVLVNEPGYTAYNVINWLTVLFAPVYNIIMLMSCITIGCVLAKKHKILTTILVYYGVQMGISFVESILTVVPTVLLGFTEQIYVYYASVAAIGLLTQVGISVGGYFLSNHLMRHKLNLP